MIIMIIFLALSVTLVIFTAVYLDYKKKNINRDIKQSANQDKKGKRNNKKQLRDLFQIEIKDNIVCLGNRYSNIIRLGNIDYNMLSNHEQDSIESILIQTALSIDYPVQFFSTTEFIDTSKVVALIKQNKNNNKNVKVQEYREYLISYLENLMENRTISVVKNYAIISYDGLYENAIEELNRKSLAFRANLLRAKIVCEILNQDEINDLIYRELNKNSSQNISRLKKGVKHLYVGKKQETRRKKH